MYKCEPGSLVNIGSGYGLDDRAIEVRSQADRYTRCAHAN
jgi:hypothetical protein